MWILSTYENLRALRIKSLSTFFKHPPVHLITTPPFNCGKSEDFLATFFLVKQATELQCPNEVNPKFSKLPSKLNGSLYELLLISFSFVKHKFS